MAGMNIGLMGRSPVQTRNGLFGLLSGYAPTQADEGDEAFLRAYAQRGREGQPMPMPAVQPAPGGAVASAPPSGQRGRVNPLNVIGRSLLPGLFDSIDTERMRLQAEADRPQMMARAQENEAIARVLGPEALLAYRLNGEKLGGELAEGFGTDVVAGGSSLFSRGRRIGEQPTYSESGDTTLERTSQGVRPVFTRTDPSITERTAMDRNVIDREKLAFDQSTAGFELSGGQTRFNAQGQPIASVAPAPSSARPLSRGQEAKLEEYYGDVASIESTQQELDRIDGLIASGSLNLGPVTNAVSGARNFLNMSDENSRNYADFQATLQKLINDSLRLNKGVQTEGDAQRAATEILRNPRDEGVVRAQLARLRQINERAKQFRQERIGALEGQGATSGGASGPIAEDAEGNRVQWNGSAWVPI